MVPTYCHVGVCHFSNGVSHIKQMTRCEHCNLQWTIVPIIAHANATALPQFVHCIRSLVKFIYRAQSLTHTNSSLLEMVVVLQEFHRTKHSIIEAEARHGAKGVKADFNIPKLELLQSFAQCITANSTLPQYSADVSECLLITHCKIPFQQTSHQGESFVREVVAGLNCLKNICSFNLYHILHHSTSLLETLLVQEDSEVVGIDPTLSFVSCIAPNKEISFKGP